MQMVISGLLFERLYSGNFLDDLERHHYFLTFSGESGLFTQFADEKKAKAEAGIARDFEGGGTLTIADRMEEQGYLMTGFNLWDPKPFIFTNPTASKNKQAGSSAFRLG